METLFYLIYACIVALFILAVVQSVSVHKLREQVKEEFEFNQKLKKMLEGIK